MRCFWLSRGADKRLFELFPQENFFQDAGRSLHSSGLLVEMNCRVQIIKELSALDNKFGTEAVLEKGIQRVHVLIGETKCIQLL